MSGKCVSIAEIIILFIINNLFILRSYISVIISTQYNSFQIQSKTMISRGLRRPNDSEGCSGCGPAGTHSTEPEMSGDGASIPLLVSL